MIPSSVKPSAITTNYSSLDAGRLPPEVVRKLLRFAKELIELEPQRMRPPGLEEYAFGIERMIFQAPSPEMDLYRKTQQEFLNVIGCAISYLAPHAHFDYPRDFLDKIIDGLQGCKVLGFTDEAIQQLGSYYRPWSEEIIHFCEMGLNAAKKTPTLTQCIMSSEGLSAEKGKKGLALVQAFENLKALLLKCNNPCDLGEDLNHAILDFDRAWWMYLYLFYNPMTGTTEERNAEIEKRVTICYKERLEVLTRFFNKSECFSELEAVIKPFSQLMEKVIPEVDKEGKPTKELPPLLKSISGVCEAIEKWYEDPQVQETVDVASDRLRQNILAQLNSTPVPSTTTPVEAKPSIANSILNIDVDTVIARVGEIPERTVDYSHYRGRFVDFITDHFEIVFQGEPVKDLAQVKEFYLTDIHTCLGHRTLYTTFADLFATPQSIIFAECVKALQICEAREAFHTCSMKNLALVMGWDLDPSDITNLGNSFRSDLQSDNDNFYFRYKMLNPGITQEQRVQLLRQFLIRLVNHHKNFGMENLSQLSTTLHKIENEDLPQTFVARTENMMKAVAMMAPRTDRSIIIAGEAHLIRHTVGKYRDDSRFDLDTFLAFLQTRNAVILKPKPDKLKEAETPYLVFAARLHQAWTEVLMRNLSTELDSISHNQLNNP